MARFLFGASLILYELPRARQTLGRGDRGSDGWMMQRVAVRRCGDVVVI